MRWSAASIFLSAFLLFAVQPLLGKALLPWFGGSPAVWTTCMLFFQVLLVAGYAWAHQLQRLSPSAQVLAHGGVLLVACAIVAFTAVSWRAPLLPDASWRPADSDAPTWRALRILLVGAGVPYFVLAATSPLVQRWFSVQWPTGSPWRLYALSNVGSLLALVSYPFVVEPLMPLKVQGWAWAGGFGVFAGALLITAWPMLRADGARAGVGARQPLGTRTVAGWVVRAALPSLMLLAVTNHLCQEVAAVPFLWVLPLALYLLTFVLCFESSRWYTRARFVPWLGVLLVAAAALLPFRAPVVLQIVVFNLLLFVTGMVCHGELAARRPDPSRLTSFYLAVAAGGAVGGVAVGLMAPALFDSYLELDAGLLLTGALVVRLLRDGTWLRGAATWARVGANALVFLLGGLLVAHVISAGAGTLTSSRSFYGTVRVVRDLHGPGGAARVGLVHGATSHGFQVPVSPWRTQPTAYFTARSGVGVALEHLPRRLAGEPIRVGVVGLGIGTLATYSRPGDAFRFYELSPDVVRLARDGRYFSYLSDAQGSVEVVLGDGRLALERELSATGSQGFDLLVVDAFGSDSVPAHLLTREAFSMYVQHLRATDSVLAVNVLNRTLDLAPLVFQTADALGLAAVHVTTQPGGGAADPLEFPGDWMLLASDARTLERAGLTGLAAPRPATLPALWTDDFSNLAALLKR